MLSMNLIFFKLLFLNNNYESFKIPELKNLWDYRKNTNTIRKKWAKKVKSNLNIKESETVFYPFSGGDILFPIDIFPEFKVLVLVGLEPAGKRFSLDAKEGLIVNLKNLLNNGFLITRDMEKFHKSGILTLILTQLAEIGASNISYKSFNKEVEISFIMNEKRRKIIYRQANLSDENYENWINFLNRFPQFSLLIKSASFVLQQKGFSKIEREVLKRSDLIFQDNTGVSFKSLNKNGYKSFLFGDYKRSHGHKSFHPYFQPALKKAYEEINPPLLPFYAGYSAWRVPSNFLWAVR